MPIFIHLRVSIQSPRRNVGDQVTHSKMGTVAGAGISAFSVAFLKSSCVLATVGDYLDHLSGNDFVDGHLA